MQQDPAVGIVSRSLKTHTLIKTGLDDQTSVKIFATEKNGSSNLVLWRNDPCYYLYPIRWMLLARSSIKKGTCPRVVQKNIGTVFLISSQKPNEKAKRSREFFILVTMTMKIGFFFICYNQCVTILLSIIFCI